MTEEFKDDIRKINALDFPYTPIRGAHEGNEEFWERLQKYEEQIRTIKNGGE